MMGRLNRQEDSAMDISIANDLNHFYGRFDAPDSKDKNDAICTNIPRNPTIQLSEEEAGTCLSGISSCKVCKVYYFIKGSMPCLRPEPLLFA